MCQAVRVDSAADAGSTELPVACSLGADDGAARLRRWRALVEKSTPRVQHNAHRLEIRWRLDAGAARELAALAEAEGECCPFLRWSVSRQGPDAVLNVTAERDRPEDVAAITALFTAKPPR